MPIVVIASGEYNKAPRGAVSRQEVFVVRGPQSALFVCSESQCMAESDALCAQVPVGQTMYINKGDCHRRHSCSLQFECDAFGTSIPELVKWTTKEQLTMDLEMD